jgi:hypothetical protein
MGVRKQAIYTALDQERKCKDMPSTILPTLTTPTTLLSTQQCFATFQAISAFSGGCCGTTSLCGGRLWFGVDVERDS